MTTGIIRHSCICLSVFVGSASLCNASFIIDPVTASASSYYSPDDRAPIHAVDGHGLYDPDSTIMFPSGSYAINNNLNPLPTGTAVPSSYPGYNTAPGGDMWLSNAGTIVGQTIEFDLGQSYALTSFHLWNYNESGGTSRGVQDVTLSFSTDGTNFSGIPVQEVTGITEATGFGTDSGEDYTLNPVSAQYVLMTVNTDYSDGSYTGISQIRFIGGAVPEPATLGLLSLVTPLLLKRRSRLATA